MRLFSRATRIARLLRSLTLVVGAGSRVSPAQVGGFVATLGVDTVHVERFARTDGTLEGVIVTRVPTTRVMRYRLTFDATGRPARYEMSTTDASGNALTFNGASGSMTFAGDSVVRETLDKGAMTTQKIYAPYGVFSTPSIPYVGVSYLMYEQAFAAARRRGGASPDTLIYLVTMLAGQTTPQRARVWFPAKDSAEPDYFRVAKSGYRFDDNGRLLRADWTGTTYRYLVNRVADIDVERLARAWADADKRGAGVGALSPRDTSNGSVDGAQLSVDYSRPSRRGRDLWGYVVKVDTVWRLGADMATHFTTTSDIKIGETLVPAGRYTLWMILRPGGEAQLIVNKRVNVFGTQYDPRGDLARIPLRRSEHRPSAERLTISIGDRQLEIAWGDTAWIVPVLRSP